MDKPDWADWLDERQVSVSCKTCTCIYTKPYYFTEFFDQGRQSREKLVGGIPPECTSCLREKKEAARKALPVKPLLVKVVRDYALAHYSSGWDEVVEAWEDKEIWEEIAGSKNEREAIQRMASVVSMRNDYAEEIRATAW